MNDIGTFVGGIMTGIVMDKLGKRAIILCPMLLVSTLLMFSVRFLNDKAFLYYFMMFFIGIFMGGPYNMICTTVTIDLAKQPELIG
jgi:OPA family glycerol-3-phosphate transporter-like MFS transporter 3